MFDVDNHQRELRDYIGLISAEFIDEFFPADPALDVEKYKHKVKAYCVLAHAAFEEHVERLSLEIMLHALGLWSTGKRATQSLLTLSMFYGIRVEYSEDENNNQATTLDLLRDAVEEIKRRHSHALANNQGFSLKYLRSIFTPVGVDVPQDVIIISSLRTLADARGFYAHTSAKAGHFIDQKKAAHPMSPEKAKGVVNDCLKLCAELSGATKKTLV